MPVRGRCLEFPAEREEAMPIIDVQVHPYERNHPARPWAGSAHGLESASGEEMVAAMDSVGVDKAIMVSSFNVYRYDPSYALSVYAAYPDRFRVVTPVDATDPAIDDVVARGKATHGAVGIRIILREGMPMDPTDPGLTRAFAAAARHGLPVNLLCWGRLDLGRRDRAAASGYGDRDRPSRDAATGEAAGARGRVG
jgi:L-fuconolactonase